MHTFKECKEYNILLCVTVHPVGNGKPRWDYENLWTYAEKVIIKRKEDGLAAKTKQVEAKLAEIKHWQSGQANNATQEKLNSSQSFQGNKTKEETQKMTSLFCYVCRSNDHNSSSCSATAKCIGNQGPIFLQKCGSGWIVPNISQEQEHICYCFNLPGSCRL